MFLRYALFFIILILPTVAFAQQKATIDSLLRTLENKKIHDTTKVLLLNQLCWQYRSNNFEQAIAYGREAIELAGKNNYISGESEGLNFVGIVYRNMGDYAEASKNFYKALAISEQKNHTIQIAYSNNNIGDILKAQKKFKEALPYAEKALEIFIKINDEKGMGFAYVRLGEIYQGLAIYDKAIEAFKQSLQIREKLGDKSALITSYNRIGTVNSLNKDYQTALIFYLKGLKMSEELGDKRAIAGSLDNVAWIHIRQKRYDEAEKYALKSLEVAKTIKAKIDEKNAYFTLSHIFEGKQDFSKAFTYHKKFVVLSDSIDNVEKSNQLAKMQVIHDTKKKDQERQKERELEDLKTIQKDIIIGLVVLALLGTAVAVYLTYRSRQKHIKINEKNNRQNLVLMRLGKNPNVQTGDWQEALKNIVQGVHEALHVEKVGVWKFEKEPQKQLNCLLSFETDNTKQEKYSMGRVVTFADAPTYLAAIESTDTIKANNVLEHPHTAELAEKYFKPQQVMSTIDIPIFSEVGLWGVLCCEAKYKIRKWQDHEIVFAKSIADIISIAYKSHQRKLAEELLQHQKEELILLNAVIAEKKRKVEQHTEILLDISKNEAILNGNWQVLATEVTKAIIKAIQADISQIWYYNFKENVFYSLGGYEGDTPLPTQSVSALQLPLLNQILENPQPLIVENVQASPQIDEESKAYLHTQNINALIFYPNILSEKQKGVLVCASKTARTWEVEDLAFMKSMEDEIVIAYQGYRRAQAQERIEKQNEEIAKKNESMRTTLKLIKQEQKRTDELLLNILPWEIAEELRESGHATPKQYELVTVIFTDFKGFTKIAEKLTPQEVIEELNTCFFAFDEICEKYKLEKIKTMGDGYMCAGGLPTPNTTNPIDAVNAALEMQQWMTKWAETKRAQGRNAWEVRIGIHSGEIIAGVVGKKKFSYDIWGDTVNTASRMESSGEVGKVNISAHTYELVKHAFQCTYRGRQAAKNKGEIDMYFVEKRVELVANA